MNDCYGKTERLFEYHTIEQMRHWFQLCGIKEGMKVLSIGPCNLRELRVLYEMTHQPVIGVEPDVDRVFFGNQTVKEWWNRQDHENGCPILFIQADVQEHLPLVKESFDAVVSIRVFEYLANPQKALANMLTCLCSGGLCAVGDIDGYASFHDGMNAGLEQKLSRLLMVLQQMKQFNPNIGRQLYGLFCRSGFNNVKVACEPYHLIAGKIDPREEQHWLWKFETVRQVGERVLGSSSAYEAFIKEVVEFLRDKNTLTYSNFFLVTGLRS